MDVLRCCTRLKEFWSMDIQCMQGCTTAKTSYDWGNFWRWGRKFWSRKM